MVTWQPLVVVVVAVAVVGGGGGGETELRPELLTDIDCEQHRSNAGIANSIDAKAAARAAHAAFEASTMAPAASMRASPMTFVAELIPPIALFHESLRPSRADLKAFLTDLTPICAQTSRCTSGDGAAATRMRSRKAHSRKHTLWRRH